MKHQQVRNFFKKDYPRLELITGGGRVDQLTNLSKNDRLVFYQSIFKLTWSTIHKLENTPRHPYQTIIIEYYINHVPMKDIIRKIGYGENAANKKHNEALKSFAEIFKQEQIKNKVYPLLEFE